MGAMFGSTALNTTLIKWGLNRSIAFIVTLWTFACVNFFILKYINTKVVKAAAEVELKAVAAKSSQKRIRAIRGGDGFGAVSSTNIHDFVLAVGGEPVKRPLLLYTAVLDEGALCLRHLENLSRSTKETIL